MPITELHRQVTAVALRAASGHGFALGGGNTLIVRGVIDRVTEDVVARRRQAWSSATTALTFTRI